MVARPCHAGGAEIFGWFCLQVPIVIVAEDGVSSLRYYVSVTRDLPSEGASDDAVAASAVAKALPRGLSPAQAAVEEAIADSPLSAILSNMTKVCMALISVRTAGPCRGPDHPMWILGGAGFIQCEGQQTQCMPENCCATVV